MDLHIEDLRESLDFLKDLYANVTTAIFLADGEARLVHFNDAFKALFPQPEDRMLGELCGNAIGCVYQVEEGLDCGDTSNCADCELRRNIVTSFTRHVPVYKAEMARDFVVCGERLRKHFVFTTKYARYRGEEYVLVLVDDATPLVEAREREAEARRELEERNAGLEEALRALAAELGASLRELEAARAEREELGRELRHRVGNTLQVISSLLNFEGGSRERARAPESFSLRFAVVVEAYRLARYEEGRAALDILDLVRAVAAELERSGGASVRISGCGASLTLDRAVPAGIALAELLARMEPDGKGLEVELEGVGKELRLRVRAPEGGGGPQDPPLLTKLLAESLGGGLERERAGAYLLRLPA